MRSRAGDCDALVSGGSTGAALAAALFHIKRDRGIYRPALALPLPVPGAPVTLVDVGANVDVRPEHLVQFAHMGAALAQIVLGVQRPRVGLLSIGEEPTKGTALVQEAHALLAASPGLDFVGNVEGTDRTDGVADVVVTDGFTGNIAIKLMEGASQTIIGAIRERATSSTRAKLGGLLLRPALRDAARRDRSRGPGRRLSARAAKARGRPAWPLHPLRDLAGDPARGPWGLRRDRRQDARRRSRPQTRCDLGRPLRSPTHDARRGHLPDPCPSGR